MRRVSEVYPEVTAWLKRYGFIEWDDAVRDWQYHMPEFEEDVFGIDLDGYRLELTDTLYDRGLIEHNFIDDYCWQKKELKHDAVRYDSTQYTLPGGDPVMAEISDEYFTLFAPDFGDQGSWIGDNESKHWMQFWAVLAGGPRNKMSTRQEREVVHSENPAEIGQTEVTSTPAVTDIDFLLEWVYEPKHYDMYGREW